MKNKLFSMIYIVKPKRKNKPSVVVNAEDACEDLAVAIAFGVFKSAK